MLVSLTLGQNIEFAVCNVRVDFNDQFGWKRDVMAICSGEKEKYRESEREAGRESCFWSVIGTLKDSTLDRSRALVLKESILITLTFPAARVPMVFSSRDFTLYSTASN